MPIVRHAHAKINLTLEVLGLRSDGFHEIRSVMQTISLCDTLTFEEDASGNITLNCGASDVPAGDDNLVMKAARALARNVENPRGARIGLEKRIPAGAGLGGGSSDAAAALIGLNDLWNAGVRWSELAGIAATLGSDVPFFLTTGCAVVTGRGERLAPAGPLPRMNLVVAKPEESLPTPRVYAEYDRAGRSHDGVNHSEKLLSEPHRAAELLWNDLQAPATALCPSISGILDELRSLGVAGTLVSGSGSAVFGICQDGEQVKTVADSIARHLEGVWAVAAHTVSSSPWGVVK